MPAHFVIVTKGFEKAATPSSCCCRTAARQCASACLPDRYTLSVQSEKSKEQGEGKTEMQVQEELMNVSCLDQFRRGDMAKVLRS